MSGQYIVITRTLAEALDGIDGPRTKLNNIPVDRFRYAITKDGRYVCSVNSVAHFRDFLPQNLNIVTLTIDDFPTPINPT